MFHFICKHTVIDKSAAADCFFYLYTLFCIWIDSYFYCPIYFPHLISTCLQMISIAISEQYVLFYYNTSHPWEQVFSFLFIKFFWAFMLRSTIHLTTCRGRRILVIYYVKYITVYAPLLMYIQANSVPYTYSNYNDFYLSWKVQFSRFYLISLYIWVIFPFFKFYTPVSEILFLISHYISFYYVFLIFTSPHQISNHNHHGKSFVLSCHHQYRCFHLW